MEEPFSLSQAVKDLLDTAQQKDEANSHLKQIRRSQTEKEEKIKKEMLSQGLRVVRVLQHSSGPHDVQLHNKRRKITQFTKNRLSDILEQHKDQTLDDDLSSKIMSVMNEPEYKEEEKLSIKKISMK
tara:strand:- start:479 stop:859 length:381 start_codon:yes stop_codon:yes gene_type:complete